MSLGSQFEVKIHSSVTFFFSTQSMGKAARSKLKSRHGETPSRQKKPAAINKDVSATKVNDLDNKQLELAKKEVKKKQRHEAWLESEWKT